MTGSELSNHKIVIDAEVLSGTEVLPENAIVVTINPFVPSFYNADSLDTLGGMPTLTLVQILGDDAFLKFRAERLGGIDTCERMWPQVRKLFEYYIQGNTQMFIRIAREQFGLVNVPKTSHERTSIAYQTLGVALTNVIGITGTSGARVIERFSRKQSAALRRDIRHVMAMRQRGSLAAALERDLFTELNRFVELHESWEMGRLGRFIGPDEKVAFDELVLFRDEFSMVRDLYQHGFELASKCLWVLVASQNTVKRGSPDDFGDVHPKVVPGNKRPTSLAKFDKLSSFYKIAYVAQVPGWEKLSELLNNRRRNMIGHATARHDLQTGRVVSDEDPRGLTYLEFLSEAFGVFEALSTLAQVFRACRVAASPDFKVPV